MAGKGRLKLVPTDEDKAALAADQTMERVSVTKPEPAPGVEVGITAEEPNAEPSLGERIKALQAQARALAGAQLDRYTTMLTDLEKVGKEIIEAGDAFPAGIRDSIDRHNMALRAQYEQVTSLRRNM